MHLLKIAPIILCSLTEKPQSATNGWRKTSVESYLCVTLIGCMISPTWVRAHIYYKHFVPAANIDIKSKCLKICGDVCKSLTTNIRRASKCLKKYLLWKWGHRRRIRNALVNFEDNVRMLGPLLWTPGNVWVGHLEISWAQTQTPVYSTCKWTMSQWGNCLA